MAIFKSQAVLLGADERGVGEGMMYLHLPRGLEREQDATGTLSLKEWSPTEETPRALRLADGRRLPIAVSRDALSDCSRNRILRFQAHWPPTLPPTHRCLR